MHGADLGVIKWFLQMGCLFASDINKSIANATNCLDKLRVIANFFSYPANMYINIAIHNHNVAANRLIK